MFLDTVGPVQRVQQWHTYPTWPSTIETPHKDLKTINKVYELVDVDPVNFSAISNSRVITE